MSEATILKEKGNECYKKLEFIQALKYFEEASNLDPKDPVYYSNQSAVLYEMGNYDLSIEKAKIAINLEPKEDLLKKLISRILKCLFLTENYKQFTISYEEYKKVTTLDSMYEKFNAQSLEILSKDFKNYSPLPCISRPKLLPFENNYLLSLEQSSSLLQSLHNEESPYRLHIKDLIEKFHQNELDLLYSPSGDPRNFLEACLDLRIQQDTFKDSWIKKINIVLQDENPKILARNVLLIYLLVNDNPDEKKYFSDLYFIWISINLVESIHKFLISTLDDLINCSESLKKWKLNDKTKFLNISEKDLMGSRKIWKEWKESKDELVDIVSKLKKAPKMDVGDKGEAFKQEMDFYDNNSMILPLPEYQDSNIKDSHKWKLNSTLIDKNNKYLKSYPPDTLVKISSPIYKQAPSFTIGSSVCLNMYSKSLKQLLSMGLEIHITSEVPKKKFDRIHTRSIVDSIGLLNAFMEYLPLLKESEYSCIQTNSYYAKNYKDKNDYLEKILDLNTEDLMNILGLKLEGELFTYFRWFKVTPKKIIKSSWNQWIQNLFIKIIHPPIKNPNQVIIDPNANTLGTLLNLLDYQMNTLKYPKHFIQEMVDSILSEMKISGQIQNTKPYHCEMNQLLNLKRLKLGMNYSIQNLEYCGFKFQVRQTIHFNSNHSLGLLLIKDYSKFNLKNFLSEQGNFIQKIEKLGDNVELFSNFSYQDSEIKIWISPDLFKFKNAYLYLIRLDFHMVISEATSLESKIKYL